MSKITLEQYAMGRDKLFPYEWAQAKHNAEVTLARVNAFLEELFPGREFTVSSGFRPAAINNKTVGSAKHSLHMMGLAIDIADHDGYLKAYLNPEILEGQAELLREFDLFMEHRDSCPTWCHLDSGNRADRPSRVFRP